MGVVDLFEAVQVNQEGGEGLAAAEAGGEIGLNAAAVGEAGEGIDVRGVFGFFQTLTVLGELLFEGAAGLFGIARHLLDGAGNFLHTGDERGAEAGDVFELGDGLEPLGEALEVTVMTLVTLGNGLGRAGDEHHKVLHFGGLLAEIVLRATLPGSEFALGRLLCGNDFGGAGMFRDGLFEEVEGGGELAGGLGAEAGIGLGRGGQQALVGINKSGNELTLWRIEERLQGNHGGHIGDSRQYFREFAG